MGNSPAGYSTFRTAARDAYARERALEASLALLARTDRPRANALAQIADVPAPAATIGPGRALGAPRAHDAPIREPYALHDPPPYPFGYPHVPRLPHPDLPV